MSTELPSPVSRAGRMPRGPSILTSSFAEAAAVFAVVLAAVVLATWPLAPLATTHAPSNLGDPLLNAYLFGWGGHAIVGNPLHLFHATLYNPEPLALAFTENMLGLSLPLSPLLWLTDDALLVVNVGLLLYPALAGLGAYLLIRDLAGSRAAALLGAVAFAITPARLAQIGHAHVFATWTVPFVLLFLARLWLHKEAGRPTARRHTVFLGLSVAAAVWASLTGALLIGLLFGSWLLWILVRRPVQWAVVGRGFAGFGIGLVLSVPVLVPYVIARAQHPDYRHPEEAAFTFSASPTSYLSPPPGGDLVDELYVELSERFGREEGYWEKQLFAGLWLSVASVAGAAFALAVAVRHRDRQLSVPLLGALVAAVAFVFSLGPRYGGNEDGVPLPFMVFQAVAGLTRVPARMGVVVPLGLALIACWAIAQAPGRLRRALLVASLVALLVEMLPSGVDMVRAPTVTAAHRAIADRGGVVLGLPTAEFSEVDGGLLGETVPRDTYHLFLSTANFRPIVNGYAAYAPPSYWEVIRAVQDFPSPEAFEVLKRRDIRTVVVQTALLPGTRWRQLVERLDGYPGVELIRRDKDVRVYDVTVAAGTAPA